MTRTICTVIGCAVATVLVTAMPAAGKEGLKGYAGAKLCSACHRKTHERIVTAQPHTPHASALFAPSEQNEERKVVGDFSAHPGFTLEDVAWVVGKGERDQAYLDAEFQAFPNEWNVSHRMWRPGQTGDAKKSCLGCHTTGYDVATATWSEAGVSCEACHGPGANHAKSKDKLATIVRPKQLAPERQAMICGRCHARGKNPDGLPFAVGYNPGDDLGQSFRLDETWEPGARYSQYNDLVSGKHLPQGVVCSTCHDPHAAGSSQPHQLRKQADQLCLDCHKAPLAGDQHSPPEDCVRCHMPQGSHHFESPQAVPAGTPHHH